MDELRLMSSSGCRSRRCFRKRQPLLTTAIRHPLVNLNLSSGPKAAVSPKSGRPALGKAHQLCRPIGKAQVLRRRPRRRESELVRNPLICRAVLDQHLCDPTVVGSHSWCAWFKVVEPGGSKLVSLPHRGAAVASCGGPHSADCVEKLASNLARIGHRAGLAFDLTNRARAARLPVRLTRSSSPHLLQLASTTWPFAEGFEPLLPTGTRPAHH